MIRVFWALLGFVSLGLGVVGIFLPLLPTVPFLLLTAICFTRSSKRLHDWLLSHSRFGPPIHNWYERGAISRRAKIIATATIVGALLISFLAGFQWQILLLQLLVMCGVLVFIWTRPE